MLGAVDVVGMHLAFAFGPAELSVAPAAQLIPREGLRVTRGILLREHK